MVRRKTPVSRKQVISYWEGNFSQHVLPPERTIGAVIIVVASLSNHKKMCFNGHRLFILPCADPILTLYSLDVIQVVLFN